MSVFYTEFQWHGAEYWLKYNFDAMTTLDERFPETDYAAEIVQNYAGNMEVVCAVASELMTQGEAIRRFWGYPGRRLPSAEELRTISTPAEYVDLVVALVKELLRGNGKSEADPEDDDPWLLEAEKKKNFLRQLSGSAPEP